MAEPVDEGRAKEPESTPLGVRIAMRRIPDRKADRKAREARQAIDSPEGEGLRQAEQIGKIAQQARSWERLPKVPYSPKGAYGTSIASRKIASALRDCDEDMF